MEAILSNFRQFSDRLTWLSFKSVGAPTLVLLILALLVVPLPPFLLDVLFTFNIYARPSHGHDYAQHPKTSRVLVVPCCPSYRHPVATRSQRRIHKSGLVDGHTGTDAAGKVIESFGEFVIAGNYVVGFIIFLILMIINFIVVTKGAGRVSEVIARFTLDAMPGKQMAIDADLNAGLIDQEEAKQQRKELTQENDFTDQWMAPQNLSGVTRSRAF